MLLALALAALVVALGLVLLGLTGRGVPPHRRVVYVQSSRDDRVLR